MSHIWTVAEAKSRLSEVLRLAADKPQRIGTHKRFVVVPEALWEELMAERQSLGPWLVANMTPSQAVRNELGETAEAYELPLPDRTEPPRPNPYDDAP